MISFLDNIQSSPPPPQTPELYIIIYRMDGFLGCKHSGGVKSMPVEVCVNTNQPTNHKEQTSGMQVAKARPLWCNHSIWILILLQKIGNYGSLQNFNAQAV